jgi:co-chaperonin GroES (HSP10)
MKLLGNRLLVKPVIVERSAVGLHLPSGAQDPWYLGAAKMFDVLAVGTGRVVCKKGFQTLIPVEAKPGERVLARSYTEGVLQLDDGTGIISEHLILAIIPKDKRYEIQTTVP